MEERIGTFGLKLPVADQPIAKPRVVNYKAKAKNRKANKAKAAQARHMKKVA